MTRLKRNEKQTEAERERRIEEFGEYLKRARLAKQPRLTQQELARESGLSHGYVGFVEQKRVLPSRSVVKRLAEALGVDTGEALAAAGYQPKGKEAEVQLAPRRAGLRADRPYEAPEMEVFESAPIMQADTPSAGMTLDAAALEFLVGLAWRYVLEAPDSEAAYWLQGIEEFSLPGKVGYIVTYQNRQERVLLKPAELQALHSHLRPATATTPTMNNFGVLDAASNRELRRETGANDDGEVLVETEADDSDESAATETKDA